MGVRLTEKKVQTLAASDSAEWLFEPAADLAREAATSWAVAAPTILATRLGPDAPCGNILVVQGGLCRSNVAAGAEALAVWGWWPLDFHQ